MSHTYHMLRCRHTNARKSALIVAVPKEMPADSVEMLSCLYVGLRGSSAWRRCLLPSLRSWFCVMCLPSTRSTSAILSCAVSVTQVYRQAGRSLTRLIILHFTMLWKQKGCGGARNKSSREHARGVKAGSPSSYTPLVFAFARYICDCLPTRGRMSPRHLLACFQFS